MAKTTPNTSADKQLADAEKAEALGPMAKQEIRYRKRTYAPGEHLPADIEDEALTDLRRLGAI